MRCQFIPEHERDGKVLEYYSLTQGSMTVHELYTRFEELARFTGDTAPELERVRALRFNGMLNFDVKAYMGAA